EHDAPPASPRESHTRVPVGKAYRLDQARAYHARASSVVDKTRNLIALEAEDAALRAQEYAKKKEHFQEARDRARKYADEIRKDFQEVVPNTNKPPRESLDNVIDAGILAAQMRVEYNHALYQYDLALTNLERVTGGGFCAGFDAYLCNGP